MRLLQLYSPAIVFALWAIVVAIGLHTDALAATALAVAFAFHVRAQLELYAGYQRR